MHTHIHSHAYKHETLTHTRFQVKQFFPRGGSEMTAVHAGDEFTWKDYAPMAFRWAPIYTISSLNHLRSTIIKPF
jgi:hypothetical protein